MYAFLLHVRPRTPRSDRRNVVVEALLQYGVTADGATPEEAHDMLGAIYAAAVADGEMRVVSEPVPPDLWAAHRSAPRPCIQLEAPVRTERPVEHRWIVDKPLDVKVVDSGSLDAAGASDSGDAPSASDAHPDPNSSQG